MRSHTGSAALVNHIYAAMYGEGSWRTFLDEVRRIVPNGQSFLFYHDTTSESGAFSLSSGLDADASAAYSTYYSRLNPFMPHAAIRPLGQAVQSDRMLPRDVLKRSEYYNDFLRPLEIEAGVGVTINRNGGCNFLFSVMCAEIDEAQAEVARDCVQALVPHLKRAFDRARSGAGSKAPPPEVVQFDRCGILRVGPGGRVHAANAAALEIVESTAGLRIDRSGRLVCTSSAIAEATAAALAGWGSAEAFVKVGHLRRDAAALPLRFTVIRSAVDDDAYFRGPESVVLIEDPAWCLSAAVEEFGDMHGLTRAERRVVLGIVNGFSVEEIAEAAGTSAQTVRSQIKRVFVRTGLNRQIDLVRHVCLLAGTTQPMAENLAFGLPSIRCPVAPPRQL